MQTTTEERLLNNRKLMLEIEPVSTLGIDGTFAPVYRVSVEMEPVRYNDNGHRDNFFERLYGNTTFFGFAVSLPDAIDLCKRIVMALETELNKSI